METAQPATTTDRDALSPIVVRSGSSHPELDTVFIAGWPRGSVVRTVADASRLGSSSVSVTDLGGNRNSGRLCGLGVQRLSFHLPSRVHRVLAVGDSTGVLPGVSRPWSGGCRAHRQCHGDDSGHPPPAAPQGAAQCGDVRVRGGPRLRGLSGRCQLVGRRRHATRRRRDRRHRSLWARFVDDRLAGDLPIRRWAPAAASSATSASPGGCSSSTPRSPAWCSGST